MRRRDFISLIGSAAVAWPLAAGGQDHPQKPPLIGFLAGATLPSERSGMFVQGLQELGYIEGRDFHVAYRAAEGYQDRLPALAEELVALKPAVMIGAGLDAAVALSKMTKTIPIVSPTLADATHLGLIASESHPAGNVTGIEPYVAGLPAKQIESALQVLASRRVDVVIVLQTSMLLDNSRQIAISASAKRLPTVYGYREHVVAGGLVSYGVDLRWCYRRSASFVDKILHGARPGDLPVEFPSKMLLSVNLQTAKALGISVPSSLLVRADEVIE